MKSRTSCCNGAVLKRTIVKGLPLWGAYLLIWLVAMPANLMNVNEHTTLLELRQIVLRNAANSSHTVAFF